MTARWPFCGTYISSGLNLRCEKAARVILQDVNETVMLHCSAAVSPGCDLSAWRRDAGVRRRQKRRVRPLSLPNTQRDDGASKFDGQTSELRDCRGPRADSSAQAGPTSTRTQWLRQGFGQADTLGAISLDGAEPVALSAAAVMTLVKRYTQQLKVPDIRPACRLKALQNKHITRDRGVGRWSGDFWRAVSAWRIPRRCTFR